MVIIIMAMVANRSSMTTIGGNLDTGTVDVGNVGQVTIQQDGVVVSGPQGPMY